LRVLKRLCEGGISVKAQQAIKHHVDLASRSQQVDQQTAADHHKA
jgi:hypothetical protein